MRTFITLTALVALTACPVAETPAPTPKPEPEAKAEPKQPEAKPEPAKPAPDVSIFGFKAETARYAKGKLTLGTVDEKVTSPDGKYEAEILKIIESNLFPDTHPMPRGDGPTSVTPAQATHAWLDWSGKTTEVALSNPLYSAGAASLTLDVEVIDGPTPEGSLGPVELRLQDCPDQTYVCAKSMLTACNNEIGPVGTCWQWLSLSCTPCHCSEDMKECVEKNPKCCGKEDEPCYPARLGPNGWERNCL